MSITANKTATGILAMIRGINAHSVIMDDMMDTIEGMNKQLLGKDTYYPRPATRLRAHYRMKYEGRKQYAFVPEPGSIEWHDLGDAAVFRCNCGHKRAEELFALWLTTKRLQE